MMWRAMGVMVLLAAFGTVAVAKDVTVAAGDVAGIGHELLLYLLRGVHS